MIDSVAGKMSRTGKILFRTCWGSRFLPAWITVLQQAIKQACHGCCHQWPHGHTWVHTNVVAVHWDSLICYFDKARTCNRRMDRQDTTAVHTIPCNSVTSSIVGTAKTLHRGTYSLELAFWSSWKLAKLLSTFSRLKTSDWMSEKHIVSKFKGFRSS